MDPDYQSRSNITTRYLPQPFHAAQLHDVIGREIMNLWQAQTLPDAHTSEDNYPINRLQQWALEHGCDESIVGKYPATGSRSFNTHGRDWLDTKEKRDRLSEGERFEKRREKTTPRIGIDELGDKLHMAYREEGSGLGDLIDMERLKSAHIGSPERNAYQAIEAMDNVRKNYARAVKAHLTMPGEHADGVNKFATAYEIKDELLTWEGKPCGKTQFLETIQNALDALSPDHLPTIPIRIHRDAMPRSHWEAFEAQQGGTFTISGDYLRLNVPNDRGPIRHGLEKDLAVILTLGGPNGENMVDAERRAATTAMMENISHNSGHLGGTLLMLRGAGRRALNHEATHTLVVRTQGNLPIIGECFRIVETMGTVRNKHLKPVIEEAYRECKSKGGDDYKSLHCDKNVLFMMTGGREFMQRVQEVNWPAVWPSIKAVQESIAFHEKEFDQEFSYTMNTGKTTAEQIRTSLDAMKSFARRAHVTGTQVPCGMDTGSYRVAG